MVKVNYIRNLSLCLFEARTDDYKYTYNENTYKVWRKKL